ncbi:MAG: dihydrodipicolinate synthase family protein [Firmicutes bacterium]|nr:dihydrodipicolinate synthase family protein [Bacillota bacterium]
MRSRVEGIEGIIVAMVTPFDDEGSVDAACIGNLVDFLIEKGVNGLYPCGTTGEALLLSTEERKYVAESVVEAARGRVPVIIHTGHICAETAIELTRHARDIGAAGAGIVAPYFYNVGDEGIYRYYAQIAQAVPDFPLLLYNIPQCTVNRIRAGVVKRLMSDYPNIVGVKNSTGDLAEFRSFVELAPAPDFSVYLGCDGLLLASLCVGGRGAVSGNACVFPEPYVELYSAWKAGDLGRAREIQRGIDAVKDALRDGGDISFLKNGLRLRGVDVGEVRAPLVRASGEEVAALKRALERLESEQLGAAGGGPGYIGKDEHIDKNKKAQKVSIAAGE